jgi:hypothetical protein
MAVRKTSKPRSKRSAATQFLVVRGRGSAVLISRVQFAGKSTSLAKSIDRHPAVKGVTKARGAFVVSGRAALMTFTGIHLGQQGRPARPKG